MHDITSSLAMPASKALGARGRAVPRCLHFRPVAFALCPFPFPISWHCWHDAWWLGEICPPVPLVARLLSKYERPLPFWSFTARARPASRREQESTPFFFPVLLPNNYLTHTRNTKYGCSAGLTRDTGANCRERWEAAIRKPCVYVLTQMWRRAEPNN